MKRTLRLLPLVAGLATLALLAVFRMHHELSNATRWAVCDLDAAQIELRAYHDGTDPQAAYRAGVLGQRQCGADGVVIHYDPHGVVLAERCVYYMGCTDGNGPSHDLGVLSEAERRR